MATNKTNDQNFKADVLEAKEPVLVDFWAEWCGPCKMMASTVTEAMSSGMNITKIDVDEDQDMSVKHSVRSVPTMILVNENGEEKNRVVGLQTLTALKDFYNG